MSTNTINFCARETLKSEVSHTETGNTSKLCKKSSKMQRQEDNNQNPPSDQESEEKVTILDYFTEKYPF